MHSVLRSHLFRNSAIHGLSARRASTLPSPPVIASIVVGLPLALWTYKCCMMVLFQRRIIYMGYVPLGARKESLADVPAQLLGGISCEVVEAEGRDGMNLAGILVQRNDDSLPKDPDVVIVYLQGNAGNPLHRIPIFQQLCASISPPLDPKIAVLSVAPRSYWKSTARRPTQIGITRDYQDVLRYALRRFPTSHIVIYGHSLGGAAAICALAELEDTRLASPTELGRIRGLVLENPFSSIPDMVRALYPQKWLPYRHLAPLAFDKWDAVAALAAHVDQYHTILGRVSRDMLVLLSEYDEIVPTEMGARMYEIATRSRHSAAKKVIIPGALHENAWGKKRWLDEMKRYISHIWIDAS